MKIAVEGCCHGELDKIYETLAFIESREGIKVDLLLICGDFQAVRNESDLKAMAVPPKYQRMNTFYKYYSGEKKAPVLTIFIGGNHEASNYLQELPYGGWVAPDIYYLGYAGVVRFNGVRIGGLSGIYKPRDYTRGHFEHPPYNDDTKRSCYHIRNIDVFRLKQIKQEVDIFMSHDWPRGIYQYGDVDSLIRRKRFLADEITAGTLGSMPTEELLYQLKPTYWFSAHLHVKFAALINHDTENGVVKQTKFLSLDKCLPKRHFLQILDVNPKKKKVPTARGLELDPEWLCILRSTNHLMRLTNTNTYMPGPGGADRYDFSATESELESLAADFGGMFKIPENFSATVSAYCPSSSSAAGRNNQNRVAAPQIKINPQTTLLCDMLGVTDPFAVFSGRQPFNGTVHVDHQPALGAFDDDDTNDSLDVDDRDEGILDDSDFIDTTFESASSSFVGAASANVTFNPDEISLDDDDEDCPPRLMGGGDQCVEPPVKRLSLSPRVCRESNASNSGTDNDGDRDCDEAGSPICGSSSADKCCDNMVSSSSVEAAGIVDQGPSRNGAINRLKRRNLQVYSSVNQDSSDES